MLHGSNAPNLTWQGDVDANATANETDDLSPRKTASNAVRQTDKAREFRASTEKKCVQVKRERNVSGPAECSDWRVR